MVWRIRVSIEGLKGEVYEGGILEKDGRPLEFRTKEKCQQAIAGLEKKDFLGYKNLLKPIETKSGFLVATPMTTPPKAFTPLDGLPKEELERILDEEEKKVKSVGSPNVELVLAQIKYLRNWEMNDEKLRDDITLLRIEARDAYDRLWMEAKSSGMNNKEIIEHVKAKQGVPSQLITSLYLDALTLNDMKYYRDAQAINELRNSLGADYPLRICFTNEADRIEFGRVSLAKIRFNGFWANSPPLSSRTRRFFPD